MGVDDISVILPTRNERANIPLFVASLHPAVELIVVDASNDGTAEQILGLRPDRTCVVRSHVSIAPARQLGAQSATGCWLAARASSYIPRMIGSVSAITTTSDQSAGADDRSCSVRRVARIASACESGIHHGL